MASIDDIYDAQAGLRRCCSQTPTKISLTSNSLRTKTVAVKRTTHCILDRHMNNGTFKKQNNNRTNLKKMCVLFVSGKPKVKHVLVHMLLTTECRGNRFWFLVYRY